ncbi:hypothetical protein [Mesorhizobium sp.]|uniref:hypothetical protein n=1 Tax=Mesorhizobium sp. TaxID=1871066 RepID=UPI000FE48E13|nr:hypothetical protein [Mesorhizobium sp.]RWI93430.1 MAG: hypothetical protein EOR22_15360 [Mesorhizobium sp.]TIQ05834.1 MAG: hypothetical protein E5X50_20330 [Mesorhizobium sp.]TIR18346.1 MAG: hypothetical protein E5X33_23000 [Mesorhizobium sp.]
MHPDALFLERCAQIQMLVESKRQIEILDIGGRLRQMFLDPHNLVAVSNINKVKLRFEVGHFSDERDPFAEFVVFLSLLDGIDPYTSPHPDHFLTLNLDDFMGHHIMSISGKRFHVKDVIRFTSHVAGSIHYDPTPRPEYEVLDKFSKQFSIGGLSAGMATLRAIGRVSLRGLQPLIADVKARYPAP